MPGSMWKKWDLHVHSPESVLHNNFGGTTPEEKWSPYFKRLRELQDFAVLGITDYFSIEGYKKVVAADSLPNVELVLPNVELRMLPVTGESSAINIHVIFDPSLVESLDDLFFSKLTFEFREENYTCLRSGLIDLGRAYVGDSGLHPDTAYREGVNQFKVTLAGLKSVFKDSERLRRGSLIVVSNSSDDGASGLSHHSSLTATRLEIYRFSHCIFSGNPSDREYFLGKGADAPEEVQQKCGKLMACIHGSDAHSLISIGHPCSLRGRRGHNCETDSDNCELRFCWIKAEASFEGLRQILFEPDERVNIGPEPPPSPLHRINRVQLTFPADTRIAGDPFCFSGSRDLEFSPYLNCIIGGRGTGKSTLLNLIAEKLTPGTTDFPLLRSISLPDGHTAIDYVAVDADEEKYLEFIGQNQIQEIASNAKALTTALMNRLYRLDVEGNLQGASRLLAVNLSACETHIKLLRDKELLLHQKRSKTKEKQAHEKIRDSIESDRFKELMTHENGVVQHLTDIDHTRQKFVELVRALENLVGEEELLLISDVKDLDDPVLAYEKGYRGLMRVLKRVIVRTRKLDFETTDSLEQDLMVELKDSRHKVREFLRERGITDENLSDISTANDSIARLSSEIAVIEKEIDRTAKLLMEFDEANLMQSKATFETELQKMVDSLSRRLAFEDPEVKAITLEVTFDIDEAKKSLLKRFRKMFDLESERGDYLGEYLFRADPRSLTTREALLSHILSDVKQPNKTQQLLSQLFSQDIAFETYRLLALYFVSNVRSCSVIAVSYDGRYLEQCSFGQRCTAAIILLLAIGNRPIMIDEPEAHLDSALIANSLVNVLKKAKRTRQIIFATHNANLVVNGDSELIYSLDMSGNITSATAMTIEDLTNRPKLLSLEGGKEAFKLRGDKYAATAT